MISDEMRELLSVHADGELRDKDVVRVEEMAKRDPEICKEIQAYKLLRKKLRSWDQSEQDEGPSPLVREQALRRALAYLRSRAQQRKGALLDLVLRPIALAAALLIAVALGIVVASGTETPQPSFVTSDGSVVLTPLADDEALTLPGAVEAPAHATPELLQARPRRSLIEENGDRLMHEGRAYSRNAFRLRVRWTREDALWAAQKARLTGSASKSVPTVNIPLKVLLGDFSPAEAPAGSFVTIRHRGLLDNLKGLRAALGTEKVTDHVLDPGKAFTSNEHGVHPILFLQGEVLVAGDKSKRTRIVASDFWLDKGDAVFMPIIWADDVAVPKVGRLRLKLQSEILGSDIRRDLVGAVGRDKDLVALLKGLTGYFKSKLDNSKIRALLRPLQDPKVTGFAILEGDRVRGVELFGSHALLDSFAERLIRGYVRQGGAALTIKPLSGDRKAVAFDAVRNHMARLPEVSLKSQEQRTRRDGYPGLMENITLRGTGGKILGHGLIQDDSLVHLTVFAE